MRPQSPRLRPAAATTTSPTTHHGASGEAPENTLAAIDLALDQDADFVEVEVQRTSDGKLVAFEDITLARTTNAEEVFPDRNPWFISDRRSPGCPSGVQAGEDIGSRRPHEQHAR